MDYLSRLGVNTLWLNRILPSPLRDGGYDVTDHYVAQVDASIGDLGDMALLPSEASERRTRVVRFSPGAAPTADVCDGRSGNGGQHDRSGRWMLRAL